VRALNYVPFPDMTAVSAARLYRELRAKRDMSAYLHREFGGRPVRDVVRFATPRCNKTGSRPGTVGERLVDHSAAPPPRSRLHKVPEHVAGPGEEGIMEGMSGMNGMNACIPVEGGQQARGRREFKSRSRTAMAQSSRRVLVSLSDVTLSMDRAS
jgi:hypothetical protein